MTSRKRRRFTAEFKAEAIRLVTEKHYSVREASESLGIGENLLRRWKDEQADSAKGAEGANGAALHDELRRLRVRAIHHESRKDVYGSPRMHRELMARGRRCNLKTVARIMSAHGIRAKATRKFRMTTDSKHDRPVAPNVLDRAFEQRAPNQDWVSDITYIPTREGWLSLAAVEDLYTRKIVGWSMSERLTSRLVVDALEMAIERQLPGEGLLSHSDRGSQYASEHYQELLKRHGIRCSMSRKGDCWDNAPMESFFATLKKELVHFEDYVTRAGARESLFEYIEMFYNRVRRHSALGYKSPAEFEQVA